MAYRDTVKSREARYAGIRFRSRLEARWATFFDEAGIEWEYERRYLRVPGLRRGAGINYLPDFWLPESAMWAEVKGSPAEELLRILAIARGLAVCGTGNDLVVLGNVPAIPSRTFPVQLHSHRNDRTGEPPERRDYDGCRSPGLFAVAWDPYRDGCPFPCVRIPEPGITPELLLGGFPAPPPEWSVHPLTRARAAFPRAALYGTG
jgi:hypothetical protein